MAQQAAAPAAAVNPHTAVALWANGAPGSEGKTAPEVVTPQNFEGEHAVSSINNPSISPYLVAGRGARDAGGGGDYCAGRWACACCRSTTRGTTWRSI